MLRANCTTSRPTTSSTWRPGERPLCRQSRRSVRPPPRPDSVRDQRSNPLPLSRYFEREPQMIINRRLVLAGIASVAFATSAFADDWKAKYPEITFAVVPAENASGVTERYTPFVSYLSKELGI